MLCTLVIKEEQRRAEGTGRQGNGRQKWLLEAKTQSGIFTITHVESRGLEEEESHTVFLRFT